MAAIFKMAAVVIIKSLMLPYEKSLHSYFSCSVSKSTTPKLYETHLAKGPIYITNMAAIFKMAAILIIKPLMLQYEK